MHQSVATAAAQPSDYFNAYQRGVSERGVIERVAVNHRVRAIGKACAANRNAFGA